MYFLLNNDNFLTNLLYIKLYVPFESKHEDDVLHNQNGLKIILGDLDLFGWPDTNANLSNPGSMLLTQMYLTFSLSYRLPVLWTLEAKKKRFNRTEPLSTACTLFYHYTYKDVSTASLDQYLSGRTWAAYLILFLVSCDQTDAYCMSLKNIGLYYLKHMQLIQVC